MAYPPPFLAPPMKPPDTQWSEHIAMDGRTYFYNAYTGESRWEKPDELKSQIEVCINQLMSKDETINYFEKFNT